MNEALVSTVAADEIEASAFDTASLGGTPGAFVTNAEINQDAVIAPTRPTMKQLIQVGFHFCPSCAVVVEPRRGQTACPGCGRRLHDAGGVLTEEG